MGLDGPGPGRLVWGGTPQCLNASEPKHQPRTIALIVRQISRTSIHTET